MENLKKHVNDARSKEVAEAISIFGEMRKTFNKGGTFPLVDSSFIVAEDYKWVSHDAKPVVVQVAISLRVSRDWQDAAAALGLTTEEYARRRLLMEPPILATFDAEKVYQPVELQVKRT
jgi:hypothetical protein